MLPGLPSLILAATATPAVSPANTWTNQSYGSGYANVNVGAASVTIGITEEEAGGLGAILIEVLNCPVGVARTLSFNASNDTAVIKFDSSLTQVGSTGSAYFGANNYGFTPTTSPFYIRFQRGSSTPATLSDFTLI